LTHGEPFGQQIGALVALPQMLDFWQQTPGDVPVGNVPVGHWHCPLTHVAPVGQQTCGVPVVPPQTFACGQQTPLTMTVPVGHTHLPLTQVAPAGQQTRP